jgi:C4-dicarboxylate-specific signal transduction histidine kinase
VKALNISKWYIVVITILVAILVSVIALNMSFHRSLQMETAEQFNKQQLLLARAETANIESYIGKIKDDTLRVSQFLSMIQFNNKTLYEFLSDVFFKDVRTVKMRISFVDNTGKVLFNQGDLAPEESHNKDLIKMVKNSCQEQALIQQNTERVSIITPVCRFNSLTGAVIAVIDIQDLARVFLGPLKSGERGYAWMMDGNGNLLYHPTQPTMVGRNLYRTDTSCFQCHKSFDIEKKIIEGKGDFYGKYVAPTGEDKVLAFSTASVGDSKWIVAVSAPYSEVTMSMHTSMKFHSWLNIMIFLTASIVSAMLIDMNRKRVKAAEVARHQKETEKHAEDLERQVALRTRELTTEKEKLNTVISAIGSGIILVDNHRRILWINDTMKTIVGKDITGMQCDDFFSDCKIIGSYKANDMQTDVLSDLFGKKNKYFQVTTAPVKGGEEGVQGYIRLVDDVTDIKNMEEQMMHSEKLALLGRLTTGIVDEIGNPVTSVSSFVQMLKAKEKDEFKSESLETIDLYMNRISDILKQLSGFSKVPPLELRPWKVNNVIEDSLSLIQYDGRVNRITIVKDLLPDLPRITTDRNLLSQVIVNIILNSADAMPDGGTLTIRSSTGENNVFIAFEDSGAGIPRENLVRIFDPLHTTREKGTGIGLAVSQNIIEKLHGSLNLESELHKGSKFVITLPLE